MQIEKKDKYTLKITHSNGDVEELSLDYIQQFVEIHTLRLNQQQDELNKWTSLRAECDEQGLISEKAEQEAQAEEERLEVVTEETEE